MIEFTYKGDKNLRRRLRYIEKGLPAAADIGMLNWMTETMVMARSRTPRQTWALYYSAYAYVSRTRGNMGFAASYAACAENMSSKPFFFQTALDENRGRLHQAMKMQLDKVMKGKLPHTNRSQGIARSRAEALAKARDKNPKA